jgi:hypothetical protein
MGDPDAASNSLIGAESGNLNSLIHSEISLFRTPGNFLEKQSNLAVRWR